MFVITIDLFLPNAMIKIKKMMSKILNYAIIKTSSDEKNILVLYLDKFSFIENNDLVIKENQIVYKNNYKEYKTHILNDEVLKIISDSIKVFFIDDLGNILSEKIIDELPRR